MTSCPYAYISKRALKHNFDQLKINSGAKSKLSTVIHAALLLISVLLLPNLLALIPNACLAAILIMTGFKLTKYAIFKEQWNFGMEQFVPFVITIVVMLISDLLKGVCAGLIVAVIYIIRDNIKFSFEATSEVMNGKLYYLIKLPQYVTFFNKGYLIKYFSQIKQDSKVIIDGSINKKIDRDSKDVITQFVNNSKKKKIEVELVKYN